MNTTNNRKDRPAQPASTRWTAPNTRKEPRVQNECIPTSGPQQTEPFDSTAADVWLSALAYLLRDVPDDQLLDRIQALWDQIEAEDAAAAEATP